MARIPKSAEHEFSFQNDPTAPHALVWRDADLKAFVAYKASRTVFAVNRTNEALTQEQAEAQARAQVDFATDRIVGVRNWDVEDPESGETRRLEWPADKDAVLESFSDMPPALLQMFVDTVIVAHFPADLRSYAAVTKAVIYPNS